jgi:hypothetical protein
MNLLEKELVVVLVKYQGKFRWFRSDREMWVLDYGKWAKDFRDAGYDSVEDDASERFGIEVVNDSTIDQFLTEMKEFEIDKSKLEKALATRFPSAKSWWDVGMLFPIMFIDVDNKHVAAFYPDGIPMERYVPDNWSSEFEDFATKYPEPIFPSKEKFWVQDGVDMLVVLNKRGNE